MFEFLLCNVCSEHQDICDVNIVRGEYNLLWLMKGTY